MTYRKWFGLAACVALVGVVACQDSQQVPTEPQSTELSAELGNGYPMPSFDYKLNIIGVPKDKSAEMDNNNGRRIFVQLYSDNEVTNPGRKNNQLKGNDQNKIYLCNSTNGENDYNKDDRCNDWNLANPDKDFGVIDANATDANGALFALPDPCADADPLTACTPTYAIWARAKAGSGSATITTCADEYGDGFDGYDDIWCGDNGVTLSKQSSFKAVNVSDNLLYMTVYIDDTTDPELAACIGGPGATDLDEDEYDIYLFDNCFENYFWNYDNNGLKNLELRFYFAG
jgi:hypothetical protein